VLVKLPNMPVKRAAVLTFSCITLLAALESASAQTDTSNARNGVFVSYAPATSGAQLTLQQNDQLFVFALDPNVVVRERESASPWHTITLAELAVGEPLTLYLNPAGIVSEIDAQYELVYARLVAGERGFVVTTAGTPYKLVGTAANMSGTLQLGTFLKMRVDSANNTAFDLAASQQPFAGAPVAVPVAVTFVVSVPSNTPPTDTVYFTADARNWVPNAVRMTPLSANVWTATLTLGQGSSLKYKYTRGSWQTAETNQAGIEIPNRSLIVTKTATSQTVNDTVLRWSDLPS
jgi:hypothetical protein